MRFVSYIKQQITKYRGIFHKKKQEVLFAFENLLVLTASINAKAFSTLTFNTKMFLTIASIYMAFYYDVNLKKNCGM